MFSATVFPLLRDEFKGNFLSQRYRTKNELRQGKNLTIEYRKVELLHKQAMNVYGFLILPAQSALGKFIVYCNFTLVRHRIELEPFMLALISTLSINMMCFWCAVLEICGRFHWNSILLLKSWKMLHFPSKSEEKFMKKFKKGCRPLFIGLEGYTKIRRLSVIKFIKGTIQGFLRAHLAL
jgi:hypothetical protein